MTDALSIREAEAAASPLVAHAHALVITDTASYEAAGEFRKQIKQRLGEIDATFGAASKAAHRAHVAAKDLERRARAPFLAADDVVEGKRLEWRRRLEAAAEEARKQAVAEVEALRARAANEAAMALALGDTELATEIVEQAADAAGDVMAAVPTATAKGFAVRTSWRFRVVDAAAVPREYLCVDERKLGETVRRLKGYTQIPGVEVYAEQTEGVR